MRGHRDEYLTRFVTGHAATPRRLRAALLVAFADHQTASVDEAIELVHALQGTAALLGLHAIHELGAALEEALWENRLRVGELSTDMRASMLAAVDLLEPLLTRVTLEAPLTPAIAELATSLRRTG